MKIFFISQQKQQTTNRLLQEACKRKRIESVFLDPDMVDHTTIGVQEGDALYRVSDAANYGCLELEYQLVTPQVATFYKNNDPFLINCEEIDSFLLPKYQVPVPKTINYLSNNRDVLKKSVEKLGGFPLIIKALGGSHGVGVMRIDSYESLFSVSDFLYKSGGQYVMKQYVDVKATARLIVLGDEVIDSIQYRANANDFRSNEGKVPNVFPATYDNSIKRVAVQAVKALQLEFGGVDILLTDNAVFVAEVNFPCFFARCELLTKTDISGMMIDYLQEKARHLL